MPSLDSTVQFRNLGVVLPARNEAPRIGHVLNQLDGSLCGLPTTVVVVDDGSSDATAEIASGHGVRVISHAINVGKGAALKTGCEALVAAGCDVLILMDADGQHRPEDLPSLLEPILSSRADMVIARRAFGRDMPTTMRLGNWGLSHLLALFFGVTFDDTQCGLRALSADAYRKVGWTATGYAVETEMLVRAAQAGLRIAEVEIDTIYHDAYKGTTITDGVRILGSMIRWRMGN